MASKKESMTEPAVFLASTVVRSFIMIGIVGMMAVALLTLAAAGATLDDPKGPMRVGMLIGAYLLPNLVALAAMMLVPSRKWPWIMGGSLVTAPELVLMIGR